MNIRLSLLWRTLILLTIFVVLSQITVYFWIKRSVTDHFEVMDSEMLTHAAFNLRKSSYGIEHSSESLNPNYNNKKGLGYGVQVFGFTSDGQAIVSDSQIAVGNQTARDNQSDFRAFNLESYGKDSINILDLMSEHGDKQFELQLDNRPYRSVIITSNNQIYLLVLPIDVHHLYLHQFSLQLKVVLVAMTLLLLFIAAFSVYWGFSPLTTFIQKMKTINSEQLGERITVADMPSELRPLAESYNIMMSKLEDNFESLSRYSDNIAHELRTPIATLSTQTQVMLSKPRQISEYIEQLHHQHETLEHLSEVTNNMLLLAKTQKGLSQEQLKDVDMDSLITQLIEYYELLADDRGINLVKSGEFAVIKGDKGLLQRLFSNLISNAIYYSKNDSTIKISAGVTDQSQLNIVIENQTAQPMTQKEASRLFERFYRQANDQDSKAEGTSYSGTGLGLSIVKSIVKAHRGTVAALVEDNLIKISVKLPLPK